MIKISFEKKPKKKSFVRFSKKCLAAMIVLWFIAAFVCVGVVVMQLLRGDMTVNTADLVTCVGMPMTGGVIGYMIKSALEDNVKKKDSNTEDNSI